MKTIALTAALMCGILLLPHVYAQVEIRQSTTTSNNGQTRTTSKEICSGNSCAEKTTMKLDGGTLKVTTASKFADIEYCNTKDKCHTWVLYTNGTWTQEN